MLFLFIFILFVFAGLGREGTTIAIIGGFFSFLVLGWIYFLKKKLEIPPGTYFYLVFILLFAVSLFWSNQFYLSLGYFLIYLTAGLLWIVFYNLREEYSDHFLKL